MQGLTRFAVYYTPDGALGDFGARWLGWDARAGRAVDQPRVAGLDMAAITDAPRRYGFHATMKAPFRLAGGEEALRDAFVAFCVRAAPVTLAGGLRLARLGGFLGLIPAQDSPALAALEAGLVRALDPFRAALTAAEVARRQPDRLTPQQRANLHRWGYPFVMESFRFHLTLTGDLDEATAARAEAALAPCLTPLLGPDHRIDRLSLMGEDASGFFHVLQQLPLAG